MDNPVASNGPMQDGVNRRSLIGQFGRTAAAVMAVGAAATAGVTLTSLPAEAQGITDADILNFALNLEYVEAQYYIRAFLGRGLDAADVSDPNGVGNAGFVLGGSLVPFKTPLVAGVIERITVDKVDHIRFIRRVLGNQAVDHFKIDSDMNPAGISGSPSRTRGSRPTLTRATARRSSRARPPPST